MSNKIIITLTLFFLMVSFIFLATVERKKANLDSQNIWMLYFNDPKSDSLDFKIENHSTDNTFHWKILINKAVAKEGDAIIGLGETKNISIAATKASVANSKITISVTDQKNNAKEVYKSF